MCQTIPRCSSASARLLTKTEGRVSEATQRDLHSTYISDVLRCKLNVPACRYSGRESAMDGSGSLS